MPLIDTLKQADLFGEWDTTHLAKIADLWHPITFELGAVIFREGDKALDLYLLTSGKVILEMDVLPAPGGPRIPTAVEIVRKDQVFGWSALVQPYIYTLSARCITDCAALAVRGDAFRKTMDNNPMLGYKVMKQLAGLIGHRLANTRLRLVTGLGLVLLERELRS